HVVAEDTVVMANSVSPTAGGIMAIIGGIVGLGFHLATGGGQGGSAITLLAGGCCYVVAGLGGGPIRRAFLRAARRPGRTGLGGLPGELAVVAAGLADGARYVWRRRGPKAALGATGSNRLLYGILFL